MATDAAVPRLCMSGRHLPFHLILVIRPLSLPAWDDSQARKHSPYMQVATLRSAVKLEQEQQFLIARKLQELTGSKNIKLKPIVDESLIAGFVVEYGSAQIDLSVKGKLDRISLEMQGV